MTATRILPALAIGAGLISTAAMADIQIRFQESAPKDRFTITNTSGCDLGTFEIEIDLGPSVGKLVFDTTGSGAGVEVFQPFEIAGGAIELMSGTVKDGDTTLSLRLANLSPGGAAAFTIDVDDTLTNSDLGQIRIAGGEIAGSRARLTMGDAPPIEATFTNGNAAVLALDACVS